jgi:autotransporter-associated beta strand protein
MLRAFVGGLCAVLFAFVLPSSALGQTNYQWNNLVADNWSSASVGTWNPTGPVVSSQNNLVTFNAGGVSVDDIAAMVLNGITFNNSTTTGLFLMPTVTGPQTLTLNSSATSVQPFINQNGSTMAYMGQSITGVSGTTLTFGGAGTGNLYFAGSLLSTTGVTINKSGNYRLFLLGSAATGTPTGINITGGAVEVYNAASLGSPAPITLNGGTLTFGVNLSGLAVGRTLTIGASGGTIDTPDINASTTYAAGGNILIGSGTLTKTGAGGMQLTGDNTGFTGAVNIQNGPLTITSANGLGTIAATAAINVSAGGGLQLNTATSTSYSGLVNRPITLNGIGAVTANQINNGGIGVGALSSLSSAAAVTNIISNNLTLGSTVNINVSNASTSHILQLDGVISDGGMGFGLSADGGATLRLTNANTYTGPTTAYQATIALQNAGAIASMQINVGAFPSSSNGQLTLDHTGTNPTLNRLAAGANVNLRDGTVNFLGNATLASTTTIPTVNLVTGNDVISVVPGATASAALTISNISRGSNRATLYVRSNSLGQSLAGNVGNVIVGNYASLPVTDFVGTGSPINLSNMQAPILRYGATGTAAGSTAAADFLTYGANGLIPLAPGQYDTSTTWTAAQSGNNIKISTPAMLTADVAINALASNLAGPGTTTQTQGAILRINSGAIISQGGAHTIGPAPGATVSMIEFADAEPIVTGGIMTFSGFVNSRNGFTRGGSATGAPVIFNNANAIYGPITLNGNGSVTSTGMIQITNENSLGAIANTINFAGGTLNFLAPSATWTRNIAILESGGQFTIGANSQAANTGFDAGPTVSLTGNITGPANDTGMLIKSGGGVLDLSGSTNTSSATIRVSGGLLRVTSDTNIGAAGARIALVGQQGRISTDSLNPINPVLWIGSSFTNTHVISTGASPPQAGTFGTIDPMTFVSTDSGVTLTQTGTMLGSTNMTKNGSGTMSVEAPAQFSDSMTFFVTGAPGQYQSNSVGSTLIVRNGGTFPNLGTMQINGGATAILDNSGTNREDRLKRTTNLNLDGGTFRYVGNDTVSSYQRLGTLNMLAQQGSRLEVQPGASAHAALTFATLAHGTASALIIAGNNLGSTPGPNVASVFFDTVPAAELIGGGGNAGTANRSILRGTIGDATNGGFGQGFVTYDSRFGVQILNNATEYSSTIVDGAASTNNIRLAASSVNLTTATTVNSLLLTGNSSVTVTGSPNLTVTAGTVASIGGNNTLAANSTFGAAQGYIFANGGTLNVTGSITGSAGLAINGSAGTVVTLNPTTPGSNTFTGSLTIDRVTVAAAPGSLGGPGGNLPDTGAALVLENNGILRNLGAANNFVAGTARTIFLGAGGGQFDTNGFNTSWDIGVTGSSVFQYSGKFTKLGSGELQYNSSVIPGLRFDSGSGNTGNFSGGVNVAGGIFTLVGTNVIFPGAAINVASGATFGIGAANAIGSASGSGTVDLGSGAGALTVGGQFANLPNATFAGNITGTNSGGLIKSGLGSLTLNPGAIASDFTGPISINAGNIVLGASIGTSTNGLLGNSATPINLGATSGTDFAGLLTGAAATIDRNVLARSGSTGLTMIGTQFGGVSNFGASRTLTIGQSGSAVDKTVQFVAPIGGKFQVDGLLARGAGYTGMITLEKSGEGAVQFTNAGSTIDARNILHRGELIMGASGTAAAGPIGTGPLIINGGTLSALGAGGQAIANNIFVNSDFALGGIGTDPLTLNGNVALGMVGNQSGSEVGRTITVNNTTTINGVVSGTSGFGSFTKVGPGTLILNGSNTYVGRTTVNTGTLRVNNPNTGSGTGMGPVTVGIGGKIGGNGFIVPGVGESVNVAGTLDPGNSVGHLTFGSATTPTMMTATGHYNFELSQAGTPAPPNTGGSSPTAMHDVVTVFGTLNVSGLQVDLNSLGSTGFNNSQTYSWTVATASGGITGSPTVGTVNGIDFANNSFFTSVVGNNLYVNFTPVPEPATVLAVCAASAGTITLIRRRRKKTQSVV